MIDVILYEYMKEELQRTPKEFHRYMYDKILWQARMVGIVGPRGVGKSTMVKQYILEAQRPGEWLYTSADHIYFSDHTLVEVADEFVRGNGKGLIIDEVHKYAGWSKELKQIYDTHPSLRVIFTGSSVLDIHKGAADLSRRALMFTMQGLSFREYLSMFENIEIPVYSLEDIVAHKVEMPEGFHPEPYFEHYLRKGYYPFSAEPGYDIRLQQVLTQTLEGDIPQYASLTVATARKLKRLLWLISKSAPYKPNMTNLSTELKVNRNDMPDYLAYLEMAGMIGLLHDDTGGFRGLGKTEKVFIDNPNLMYSLGSQLTDKGNVRETFFYNQMRVNNVVTSSKIADFKINNYIFEVGGKKKGVKQLEGYPQGFVVRDNIEFGHDQFIPLWQFGLNY